MFAGEELYNGGSLAMTYNYYKSDKISEITKRVEETSSELNFQKFRLEKLETENRELKEMLQIQSKEICTLRGWLILAFLSLVLLWVVYILK